MKDVKRAQDLIGSEVYDREGGRIGRVGNVYVDDVTRQPEWVTVRTGLFGARESFVPLRGATSKGENGINVDVTRDKVKDAPRIEAEQGHLSDSEGRDLYTYYGLHPGSTSPQQRDVPEQQRSSPGEPSAETSAESAESAGAAQPGASPTQTTAESAGTAGSSGTTTGTAATTGTASGTPAGTSTDEPTTSGPDSGTETLTRHEEKLRITTEYVESGRVRIRKYVTTERESVTVPITREEIRIEREQIPASEQRSGEREPLGATEREIVLYEERPIVNTETVAVERIRINTEQVTEEQTIEGDVRRERFDVDDSTGRHRSRET